MVNALYTILTNKNRPSRSEFLSCGGAAGYCPRVQKVTDYSSTSIVYLSNLQRLELEDRHKCPSCCVEKFPLHTPLRICKVSDINITPITDMSPAGNE